MKILLSFVLIFFVQNSFGFSLREVVARDSQNQLVRSFQAQCQPGDTFCQDLCGLGPACEVSVDSCDSCVNDTDLVTRSIILDSDRIYEVKKESVRVDSLISYFKTKAFYVMSATSLVNVFSDPQNPSDDQALRTQLQHICPAPTANPLIIIDGANPQDWSPVAIVCDDETQNSIVMPLELRIEFSKDNSSIRQMTWQTSVLATPVVQETVPPKLETKLNSVVRKAIKFRKDNSGGLRLKISMRPS